LFDPHYIRVIGRCVDAREERTASAGAAPRGIARHKVIMMTGRKRPQFPSLRSKAGAFGFLVKPFDDEAFLCLVRQALCLAA